MSVNGTLVQDKMRRFRGDCANFIFDKCLIYTHDGASAKFSTNSHETGNSVGNMIKALSTTQRGKDIERGKGGGHCRCVSYCIGGGASPTAGKKRGLLYHNFTQSHLPKLHT